MTHHKRTTLASIGLLTAGALVLSGCGAVGELRDRILDGTRTDPTGRPTEPSAMPTVEEDFPYTKQGRLFLDTGDDTQTEMSITALERTDDHTVLYVDHTYLDDVSGSVQRMSTPPTLIDPVSGRVYPMLRTPDGEDTYGSYTDSGKFPIYEGVPREFRYYFPRVPADVRQLTFVGSGMGAMTGIPVQDVEKEQPAPASPNVDEYENTEPPEGTSITFPVERPAEDAKSGVTDLESFVDSKEASTTREGDTETIALHSDVMFEFDKSELTGEATEIVRKAAESLKANVDPEESRITVIGHSDGKGGDGYNAKLSEQRADTVSRILKKELGGDYRFSTEGRGATDPVAEEGGADDEEARARNRRVEFSYKVSRDSAKGGARDGRSEAEGALGSAARNVGSPAPFEAEDGDVAGTATEGDVRLDVHPLVRDGAYLIGTVSLTNTGEDPVELDLSGGEGRRKGGPTKFGKGTLGGFQLIEPETDLVRYVAQMRVGEDEYAGLAEELQALQPGEAYRAIAVFPAPASKVTELSLHAGPFGEIEDVPVS
ncbi:outer membrane protein OmpA-like peptidoglycan-associated protein [Murinocardiopsis flavida]|uniref:Outer membrane protein OmpA-like peptidoglycan-associated protein n=1 Tax=Murinocardiopsis flavida TaxID=645275 RepID=A0A2P8DQK5_9ACTN|nr:OmpA family protein [Murinocardiopsis flavida]PSK99507.1 outer membrane protein OmpA-like peptidoglycan-associated protein [Murinocardiopsis flavida]